MKKIILLFFVLIMFFYSVILPVELFDIEELAQPSMFIVDFDRIYILEKASVYVYSLKDRKLIKKFGKEGEGPKEFKYEGGNGRPLSMSFFKEKLIVNSEMKMSFFDKDGNYLSENKVTVDRLLFPINGKFLGIGPTAAGEKKQNIGFMIYDNDKFKSPKIIFISDVSVYNPAKFTLPITSFTYNPVYKNRIYVNSSSEKFIINVFNTNGKKVDSITKNYPKIKIPDNFREEALAFFKRSPQFKNAYEYLKKVLDIRKYYPPIRDMQIVGDHIYVLTFKKEGDLWELLKLDLKGNERGRKFIPLSDYEYFTWYPIFYSIYKNKVYTLVEDSDDEVWKIHVTDF